MPGTEGMYASRKVKDKRYRKVPTLNGISIHTCVRSLIEQILADVLPQLQTLLQQRYHSSWVVVVSVMSALLISATKWHLSIPFLSLQGRMSNFKGGWNILLGLYLAAYRSYDSLRANTASTSASAQLNEFTLKFPDVLEMWDEDKGVYI